MSTLLLVRHATTAATGKKLGGRTEAPLDDAGRAQASAAAGRLRGLKVTAVYASPLARTMETARIVAAPHGLGVRPAEGLLEVEYGRWTDRPLAQVARTKLWPVIQQRPSQVTFPDGESIRAMQARAVDAVEEIVARHPKGTVVAVSHADVIKALVSFYLGQPLDLFQRIHIAPASVTALQLSPGGTPVLTRLNDVGPPGGGPGDDGPWPGAEKGKAARHG
ncbi:MAG TPA: histidine phosphatase family protein [Egibacteraceae bacterium]|nr:histidine phosphatase family protein [Egibacteraceae bacterium]